MKFLKAVRRKAVGLTILVIVCVVVEQGIHCVIRPSYLFQLLESPVFWGGFSLMCFTSLWWMNQQYPNIEEPANDDHEQQSQQASYEYYDPIWDNPLNPMNPQYIFSHAGE